MDDALEGQDLQEAQTLALPQEDPNLHPDSFRRIQACLIACEGISTEDLEGGIIHEMRQTLRDLVPILQGMRRNCA